MSKNRVFAVDLGASGGKCFAATFDGASFTMDEIHRFAYESVTQHVVERTNDLVERAIWDQPYIQHNIHEGLLAHGRDVCDHIDSIGIDTWGADFQLMSGDGEPLCAHYAYRDHRLDGMIDKVKSRIDPARIYEITGIHFQPFNLSNQLLWLVLNRRELLLPDVFCLPTPSVFTHALCGSRKVDSTWASITQLVDAASGTWSSEVLEALDIPHDILPEIVKPTALLGVLHAPIAESAGVNQANVVAVGSHDTASAFAAAPVANTAEALIISSGTWSVVGKLIPQPITNDDALKFNMSNEGGIGNTRFLRNCMGTWIVQELRRIWRGVDGKESSWEDLNRATQNAKPFAAMFDPDDERFYNPSNMETAIVEFCKETKQAPPANRGEFLRSTYESLALKYRYVNEEASCISGEETKVVHIVGGGSKNKLLNQFTANATGLPVVAGPEEATAVGNIMVQALALGVIDSLEDSLSLIRGAFPIEDYTPADPDVWNQAYARLQPLVRG